MEKVKLGEVCKVQGGYAFKSKEFQKNNIPIIRIGNIQDNEVKIDNNVCYTQEFLNKHPEFEVQYGDILIAMSGATVGKVGKYQYDRKALLNQRVGKFIVTEKLEKRYLYFLLHSPLFEKYILNNAFGCAQPNISGQGIEKFEFYNYDNLEQLEIANKLDKIQEIIDLRKQQIEQLDELIKCQFVKMFGDPILNNKNWNLNKWNEVLTIKNGRNQKKVEQEDGQYPIYGSGGIMNYANDYICKEDSVIIGRKGNINNPILVRTKFWNVDTAFGLEPCKHKMMVEYLYYFCCFYNFEKHNKAVTIPSLTKTDLLNVDIPIPPIGLQNEFAEIVKQIDKQKFEIQKSLEEIQKLEESLMNQYF